MAQHIFYQQAELDYLEMRLAVLEEYIRNREKGDKIIFVVGSTLFVITLCIGVYFQWIAKI